MLRRSIVLPAVLAVMGLGHAGGAAAQPAPSTAAAEALFQEGRALLMAGKIAEACPKLEESQRLDPATGTLMAVALCHEQQGRLASAWAEFADVEARSRLDGRADRERTAHEHGAALRPRLSTLTLEVPRETAEMPGLVISVDGVPIGRAAWNTAIPVDGGDRAVEVAAPGRRPWRATSSVKRESDHVRVTAQVAAAPLDLNAAAPVAEIAARPSPAPARRGQPAPSSTRRTVGLALLGFGAAGLGVSLWRGLDARSDYRDAVVHCPNEMCEPGPYYGRVQDAQAQGNVATAVAIAGAAAAVTGIVLWFWGSGAD